MNICTFPVLAVRSIDTATLRIDKQNYSRIQISYSNVQGHELLLLR
jgi:hypothetical protein